jgi:hypothetical protein
MLPLLLAGVKRLFYLLLYDYPTLRVEEGKAGGLPIGGLRLEDWKADNFLQPILQLFTLPIYHCS